MQVLAAVGQQRTGDAHRLVERIGDAQARTQAPAPQHLGAGEVEVPVSGTSADLGGVGGAAPGQRLVGAAVERGVGWQHREAGAAAPRRRRAHPGVDAVGAGLQRDREQRSLVAGIDRHRDRAAAQRAGIGLMDGGVEGGDGEVDEHGWAPV